MKLDDNNLTLKKRAKTFYFASLFLPKGVRRDVENLYIFCRYLDDLGDNQNLSKKESYKKLRLVKKNLEQRKSLNLVVSNFIILMDEHKIDVSIPLDLIKGIEYDLKNSVDIKDYEELLKYSYRVAGTVGYMFCKIIKEKSTEQIFRGIQLGIAMQFTNISRDVKEDLIMERIYIPKSIRTIKEKRYRKIINDKFIKESMSKDLENLLEKTDSIYLNAWNGIFNLKNQFAIPICIAAELYQRIGKKIKKNSFIIWEKRTYVSLTEKIIFSLFALIKLFFLRNFKEARNIDNEIKNVLKKINVKIK